jgi:hypothetical protein
MTGGISPGISNIIGAIIAAGCLTGAFLNFRRKRIIDDLPTSRTQGVFIGLAELKGTAESDNPLTSYLIDSRCVYYDWHIDEHWSRTVTETYTDSKGTHVRTRTESGWKTVAKGSQSIPFYLKDDTGLVLVVPDKAGINANTAFDKTVGKDDSLYFGKGPAGEIAHSTHRRRFHEVALPLHTALYVLGQARQRQDIAAAEIAWDKNAPMFLISTRTEKQISRGYGGWFWFWWVFGLVLLLGSVAIGGVAGGMLSGVSWTNYVLEAAGYLVVFGLVWLWVVYNSLVNLHHRVEQGWSQVEVQLKRRNDLIPNLVQTVEGYSKHEKETQTLITELRRQMEATPPGVAGPDFKGLAFLLRVSIENYPDLKANQSFLKLQEALIDTEQRIALARDYFNEIATFYNTRLDIIPDRFAAYIARLKPQTLMVAEDFERAPVQVKLAS